MGERSRGLHFSIEVLSACFSSPGRYFLRLEIQGSQGDKRGVKLHVNNSKNPLKEYEFSTGVCVQSEDLEIPGTLTDSSLRFVLPPEFTDGEVKLLIEAFCLPEDPMEDGDKVGQTVFTVHPRTTSVFPLLKAETSPNDGESVEVYSFETQLALTQALADEGISVSVGVLEVLVSLTMKEKTSPEESPHKPAKKHQKAPLLPIPEDRNAPGPSSAPQAESVPTTPSGTRKITDPPLPDQSTCVPVQNLCGSCVAREGYCEAVVLVHGALGLPTTSNGQPPQPYITGKSRKHEVQRLSAQSVSHAAVQPTHSPVWEGLLLVEFQEEQVEEEEIILSIAHHPSKELLTEYRIPVNQLKPFHQYQLELVQPSDGLTGDIRLYVTLILKKDKLILSPGAGLKMYGLEVVLRGVESPLVNQMGPLVAVARIVSDWKQYKEAMLVPKPKPASVTMTTIHFPSPHPTSFAVAGASHAHGSPLVTVGGTPQEQPQWNQTVFFPGNEEDMFTATTALVVEYYPTFLSMSQHTWQLAHPVGYSHHSLDKFLLSNLQHDNGKLGLKLDGLLIEGSRLKTNSASCPSVGLVLRLVMSERPELSMSSTHLASLPAFRKGPPAQPGAAQVSAQPHEQNAYGLPPMDAVRNILPQFLSVYQAESPVPQAEYSPLKHLSPEGERTPDEQGGLSNGVVARGTVDSKTMILLDAQMKEVDRYRTAMRRLATDLLHVREECKRLEEGNSRLRRELAHHDEISHLMITSQDLDHVTHSELVQKFVLLKKKLADESTKKQELQQRLQHLQNDLIKKNETEKKYIKLQEAHEGQQALLQKLQGKIQKTTALQEACKKQEKVIVQLEQLVAKQGKGSLTREDNGVHPNLSEENARLQGEVLHYKELLHAARAKQEHSRSSPAARNEPLGDQERLDLYQKLDKSEGRILGLERQLTENARKWAKEKAELQMKLTESLMAQQTGYRNSFSDLHDLDGPKPTSPGRWTGTRRASPKLDPLDRRY